MKTFLIRVGFIGAFLLILLAFDYPSGGSVETSDFSTQAGGPISDLCSMQNTTFQDGEEMVYKIFYNWKFIWLSAGELVFRVKENEFHYHLSARGRTFKSYEWFYKVRDRYDTFINKETLLPELAIRDIEEGKYRLYDKVTFYQNKKKVTSFRGKSRDKAKFSEYPVEECMHDILSIMYFSRNLDFDHLNAGEQIPIKIFMDKEVWPLKVIFKGKDKRKKVKGLGKFNTIQFGPEVIEGFVFKEGSEMNVWISDDKNKIPLLIESPVSVGSVKMVLKSYKGLKYELEAKVK